MTRKIYLLLSTISASLCLLLIFMLRLSPPAYAAPPFQAGITAPTVVTLPNGYRITFLGVTYNSDGTSTWRYRMEELPTAQDLSNWVLELPDCVSVITASPEPWEVVNPDPNAQLDGIKWQTGAGFQAGEFTVTLTGYWAVGVTRVAAKGPDVEYGELAGPICQPPFELNKTVEPAVAQPGDVLTYTVTLHNVGLVVAEDVVLTDAIPAGTIYVQNSLQASTGSAQYQAANNQILWQGDVGPQGTVTLTFNVYVQDNVVAGSIIKNTANVLNYVITATTQIEAAADPAWVLLVYLSGDNNLDNEKDFTIPDQKAFNALERAAFVNPRLRIYVQWDRSPNHADDTPDAHTRRYRIRPDLAPLDPAVYTGGVDTWDLGEKNMGDPQTLTDFIIWARGNYSSTYEALSIIGHGGGWSPTLTPNSAEVSYLTAGIAWDDSSGDYLSTAELSTALDEATNNKANPFDLLFFDASMMAMLENAYEVRQTASYLVAAEDVVWATFAYDKYVAGVSATTTPRNFAENIVTRYAASLEEYPLTMGALAIDLTALTPLSQTVDSLANTLTQNLAAIRSEVSEAYSATQKFDSNGDRALAAPDAYVDLYDFADQLDQQVPSSFTAVHTDAQAVMSALGDVVVAETHQNGQPWFDSTVTWNYDGAHGLSIYLPLGEDLWIRDYYRDTELTFARDTQWDEFIHDGWYEGQQPPAVQAAEEIDPANRPGLLTTQSRVIFLPIVVH